MEGVVMPVPEPVVTRLFPRTLEEGQYLEDLAIFAARRCRTTKTTEQLWEEVNAKTPGQKRQFLEAVVYQDWALDVLEMLPIHYDVMNVPVWLIIELLRHRLIWRDFSMEQMSQRAIPSNRLQVRVPEEFESMVQSYLAQAIEIIKAYPDIPAEDYRAVFPQGVLVNLVIAGNIRAFQHYFFMRCSEAIGGAGGAHPLFMIIADEMLLQASDVYPTSVTKVAKA